MTTSKIIFILLQLCVGNLQASQYGYVIDEIDGSVIRIEGEGFAECVSPQLSRMLSEGDAFDLSGKMMSRAEAELRHKQRIAELQAKSVPVPPDL